MPAVLNLLKIKNLALVEELEWQIEPGFVAVTGETAHPLYKSLITDQPSAAGPDRISFRHNLENFLAKSGGKTNPEPGVLWNFEKFLIDRDGKVARLFVGGSPRFDALLRQALKSVLDSPNSRTE